MTRYDNLFYIMLNLFKIEGERNHPRGKFMDGFGVFNGLWVE